MIATDLELDHTLVALADPTRRAILQRISNGEARVTDIAKPFAMSLNSISKHIRILERAHLIKRRRAGREHFLSLETQPLAEVERWITTQRALWTARLQKLDALLQAEDQAHLAFPPAAQADEKVIRKKQRKRP